MTGEVITIAVLAVLLVLALVDVLVSRLRLRRAHRRIEALETQVPRPDHPRSRRVARKAVKAVFETANRVREGGVTGLLMSSIEDFTRWALEDRAEIVKVAAADGTVTIFFSDIEDSTALNERLGDDGWMRVLEAHDGIVREQIRRHGGHVVKTQGDGFMVVFRDPPEAVRAALDIQRGLEAAPRVRRNRIRVRIGVHTGTVVSKDGDYFGRNVAMAARVASQAAGGEIVVSDEVRMALDEYDEFVLTPFEAIELKGLSGLHELWSVEPA
ncbi:MAG TPA: adenylate/guanylate cyclase domain-containing protein [Nocardioidaceae bacterium]|nr:adenylate/guanylate cyclase domain-containing protein [Nocardioidaceae bacterium]